MYHFLHSLSDVIPCPKCKRHYKENLQRHVPSVDCEVLANGDSLSRYIVDLHNEVNQRLGKRVWSYEEAKAVYANATGICPANAASIGKLETAPRSHGGGESAVQHSTTFVHCLVAVLMLCVAIALSIRLTGSRVML